MSKIKIFKPNPFKCYIDGKYYKTINGYNKDLENHMINGDWDRAMASETPENRKYIYNYRCMNGRFIPNEAPNKLNKTEMIPIFRLTVISDMMRKFELSKHMEMNE